MKKLALLLALTSAMIVSCSQGGNTKPKSTYRIDCTTSITEVPIEYYVDVQYSLSDFDKSSFTFNKSIALLSLAASLKANDKSQLQTFYSAIGFSGIVYSADYDLPDDKDAVKFTMAHYETSKYHLVSVVANGTSYEKPWESNFIIGAEGDATGFATGAEKVLAAIDVKLLDNLTLIRLELPSNAYSPIDVTLSGILMLASLVHLLKAPSPIEVTVLGIETSIMFEHI